MNFFKMIKVLNSLWILNSINVLNTSSNLFLMSAQYENSVIPCEINDTKQV